MLLDGCLTEHYRGMALGRPGQARLAIDETRDLLERVPGFREAAETRLIELDALARVSPDLEKRCYISHLARTCLRTALGRPA